MILNLYDGIDIRRIPYTWSNLIPPIHRWVHESCGDGILRMAWGYDEMMLPFIFKDYVFDLRRELADPEWPCDWEEPEIC